MNKIPVTIITGFLGSGKTTLLNNIIKKYPGTRFAIVENEFGDINIDSELVVGADQSNIFELSNGCICCSMNDDFYAMLNSLLKIRDKFDHLLIETTGIADPLSVVKMFIGSPEIADLFEIDAVVCVVDAPIFEELLDEQEEVARQLVMADIVIINKVDAVTPGYLDALKELVKRMNPAATVYATSHAAIFNADLIGIDAYSGRQVAESTSKFANMLPLGGLAAAGGFSSSLVQKALRHDIQAYSFTFSVDLDYQRFSLWMESFFYFSSSRVFRVKGIVSFKGKNVKTYFHSVKGAFMLEDGAPWGEGDERDSKLVFIGKHINRDEIEQALQTLLAK